MKSVAIESRCIDFDNDLRIEWKFTKRCNLDCSYCSKDIHDSVSKWRDLSEYKRAIDMLVGSTNKNMWISFTGGEPCIYPQFKELVKYCKEKGIYHVSATSNGSKSPEYYASLEKYLDYLTISYHFEYNVNCLESIFAAKEAFGGIRKFNVHIMMLPGYFKEAEDVMKILKDRDIQFTTRRIRPLYMADGSVARPHQKGGDIKRTLTSGPDYSDDKDYYSKKELEFFNPGKPMSKEPNIHHFIETENGVEEILENTNDILARKNNNFKGWKCWAGIQTLGIGFNGTIYNADCKSKALGNIYTDNDIKFPTEPFICHRDWCVCVTTINTRKVKDDRYIKYLRDIPK